MSYIEFDKYKFNYIINKNIKYIDINNVSNFINYSANFILSYIIMYDNNYNISYKRPLALLINNVRYISEEILIHVIMTLNYNKYIEYKEVIEKEFGYKVYK